jgi:hypothetical protein
MIFDIPVNMTLKRNDTAGYSDVYYEIKEFKTANVGKYRCMVSCSNKILLPSVSVVNVDRIREYNLLHLDGITAILITPLEKRYINSCIFFQSLRGSLNFY